MLNPTKNRLACLNKRTSRRSGCATLHLPPKLDTMFVFIQHTFYNHASFSFLQFAILVYIYWLMRQWCSDCRLAYQLRHHYCAKVLTGKQAPITTNNFGVCRRGFLCQHLVSSSHRPRLCRTRRRLYTAKSSCKSQHTHPLYLNPKMDWSNLRGTIAMARTNEPNSATVQFFINTVDNKVLDYVSDSQPGYTVFGQVIADSMGVVDKISAVPTQNEIPVQPQYCYWSCAPTPRADPV